MDCEFYYKGLGYGILRINKHAIEVHKDFARTYCHQHGYEWRSGKTTKSLNSLHLPWRYFHESMDEFEFGVKSKDYEAYLVYGCGSK